MTHPASSWAQINDRNSGLKRAYAKDMLQSLLEGLSVTPMDVQIWDCVPLVIVGAGNEIVYGMETKLEFTPFGEESRILGHAIALKPNPQGINPEISISMRQYIDNPIELGRRQGIILTGEDAAGTSVSWYINGAADRLLTSPPVDELEYDEETAKLLEEELGAEGVQAANINSYL